MISNTNNRERNLHSAPEATERKKGTRVQDVANIRAIQRLGEADCNG
jgi:hypothetical protein